MSAQIITLPSARRNPRRRQSEVMVLLAAIERLLDQRDARQHTAKASSGLVVPFLETAERLPGARAGGQFHPGNFPGLASKARTAQALTWSTASSTPENPALKHCAVILTHNLLPSQVMTAKPDQSGGTLLPDRLLPGPVLGGAS